MPQVLHGLAVLPDGSFALNYKPESWVHFVNLAATTAEAVPVPALATKCVFGASGSFAIRLNASLAGTAAALTDETSNGTGCIVNPTTITFAKGAVAEISVIARTANTDVSLSFFL